MTTIDSVYDQRNELAVALAKLTVLVGGVAGRGIDPGADTPEWGHVVYVDLPDGTQVSWHMSPSSVHLLDDLPEYPKAWDGTFVGRTPGWSTRINISSKGEHDDR